MNPSVSRTFREELLSFKSIILILVFSLSYISFYTFLSNYKLFTHVFVNDYSLNYKVNLFFQFIFGLNNALHSIDFILLIITSILVGINLVLIGKTLDKLKNQKVRLSVGGGTVFGIVAAGCTTCGLSVLSVFGITAATLNFLPFMGIEIILLAIGLLLFSAFYMLKKLSIIACEVNKSQ